MKRISLEGKEWVTVNGRAGIDKLAKRFLLLAALFLGLQAAARSCSAAAAGGIGKRATLGSAMARSLAEEWEDILYGQYMPCAVFTSGNPQGVFWLLREQADSVFPLYGYVARNMARGETGEDEAADFRTMRLAEADAEIWMTAEAEVAEEEEQGSRSDGSRSGTPEELLRAENEAVMGTAVSSFLPHERQFQVNLAPLQDYETLVRQFYTIDANTSAGSDELSVDKLLAMDLSISREGDGPQILLYHTHSQEGYSDSVPGDMSMTITGVGERLAEILREEYGYDVLHHMGRYDLESRDDAYSRALSDLEKILEEYPSIQVVIDLHRDAVPEDTRLAMDLDGRPTARFMFFNGMSRTKKTGNITYLYNENLDANLAMSFQMQLKAAEYYPGLTRRIYLKGYRYNMHLRPRSMLIELGAQNNTVEEAMNACDPLAHILDLVLSGGD